MNKKPWYKPGPNFSVSIAGKKFLEIIVLTFIAGGLQALIGLFNAGQGIIPNEYLIYSGVIVAGLKALYNLVNHYKDGLE